MSNKYTSSKIEATTKNRLVGLSDRILSRMDASLSEEKPKSKNHNKSFQPTANASGDFRR